MQRKAVVVVPPSQFNSATSKTCWKCDKEFSGLVALCPHCQALQPVPTPQPNLFEVLSFQPHLRIDTEKLRSRYLTLTKGLHPDRFAALGTPYTLYATQWSTLVNQANKVLADKTERSKYLLELFNHPLEGKKAVPVELAEAYFEIQELEPGSPEVVKFGNFLLEETESLGALWTELADQWVETPSKELLDQLAGLLNKQNYLRSMLEDLRKKRS